MIPPVAQAWWAVVTASASSASKAMLHTFCRSDHWKNTTDTIETYNTDVPFKQLTYLARVRGKVYKSASTIQYFIEGKNEY